MTRRARCRLAIAGALAGVPALAASGLVAYSLAAARRIERAVPPTGRLVEIGGHRLHVYDRGTGPAVLMIHGLAGQMRNLTGALPPLLDGLRVVAIDRPGSGHSARRPARDASLWVQAGIVAEVIDRLGLDRPVLVGHSFGGGVSLATALAHPDRVGGLALVAPLANVERVPAPSLRPFAIRREWVRRLVAYTIAVPLAAARGRETLVAIFAPDPVPADFGTTFGGLLAGRPSNFAAASADLVAAARDMEGLVARLPSLAVPVSILYGTGDQVLDHARHGIAMQGVIPGLELELVPGGHMLPVTVPGTVAGFIRRAVLRSGRCPEPHQDPGGPGPAIR